MVKLVGLAACAYHCLSERIGHSKPVGPLAKPEAGILLFLLPRSRVASCNRSNFCLASGEFGSCSSQSVSLARPPRTARVLGGGGGSSDGRGELGGCLGGAMDV